MKINDFILNTANMISSNVLCNLHKINKESINFMNLLVFKTKKILKYFSLKIVLIAYKMNSKYITCDEILIIVVIYICIHK